MTILTETGAKTRPFTVNFIDLDNDNASLAHLEEGKLKDLKVKQIIQTLQQKGYRLINNDFNPKAKDGEHDFTVTFRHTYQIIDADHPTNTFPVKALRKTGTQVVHYEGAGTRTPIDNRSQVVLNRRLVYDRVEKKIIKDNGWEKKSFRVIGTPDVAGYIPSAPFVGGETVDQKRPDRHYTVSYHINHHPSQAKQVALVKFLDVDQHNKQIAASGGLTGQPYTRINYSPTGTINYLQNQGYRLLNNGFSPNGEVQFFDNSDQTRQTYIISLVHRHVEVNSDHPLNGIDPGHYEHDRIATVHYVGAGEQTPHDNSQIIQLQRTVLVDSVSKKILRQTEWQPSKKAFGAVTTPILRGYHADKGVVPGQLVTTDHLEEVVKYTANGRIIPIDEDGNPIAKAPHPTYQTDPRDATRVLANETVPEIPGYTARVATIDPEDATTDTKVVYNKKLVVQLTALEDRGYVFINNGLNADTVARSVDSDNHGTQTYVIGLRHGQEHVTPEHPGHPGEAINPNFAKGPKWPKETGRSDLIRVGQQIVRYIGANGETPEDDEQKTEFYRTLVLDRVTGQIIKDNGWNADQRQFGTVTTPVVDGFHADKRIVGGKTVTPDHLKAEEMVTYSTNGSIVPVDPNGQPIDGAKHLRYKTDLHDATKVQINEAVPKVPGYTPTQSAVTPSQPARDTPIVYIPNN